MFKKNKVVVPSLRSESNLRSIDTPIGSHDDKVKFFKFWCDSTVLLQQNSGILLPGAEQKSKVQQVTAPEEKMTHFSKELRCLAAEITHCAVQ